jgi:hypothetical protein
MNAFCSNTPPTPNKSSCRVLEMFFSWDMLLMWLWPFTGRRESTVDFCHFPLRFTIDRLAANLDLQRTSCVHDQFLS